MLLGVTCSSAGQVMGFYIVKFIELKNDYEGSDNNFDSIEVKRTELKREKSKKIK